jgi:hypothetical protein
MFWVAVRDVDGTWPRTSPDIVFGQMPAPAGSTIYAFDVPGRLVRSVWSEAGCTPWEYVDQWVANEPVPVRQLAATTAGTTEHVLVRGGGSPDFAPWHTLRDGADGWQPTWLQPPGIGGYPLSPFVDLRCAGIGDSLHVVGLSTDYVWHNVRDATGAWQAWESWDAPAGSRRVACAAVGDELHVVAAGADRICHTILFPKEKVEPFRDVATMVGGVPPSITDVACAGVNGELNVVLAAADGVGIWHALRHADRSWAPPTWQQPLPRLTQVTGLTASTLPS